MIDGPSLRTIHAFAQYQRDRGLQPTTIESRSSHLRSFARYLGHHVLDATRKDIEAFLATRQLGARARYRWVSDLHVLFAWAIDNEMATEDPTVKIARPKLPQLLPRPIRTDDLAAAIDLAPPVIRAWLLLAAYAGLRCVEISRLAREDILEGHEEPVLMVHGKGGKARLVPLHPDALAALRVLKLPRAGPVFRRPMGGPYTANQVSIVGGQYLHDLGLDVTMHQARHWFGTYTYQTSGHDVLLVRDLLGHASVKSTEGYAAFDRRGAAAAVTSLHL